MTRFLTHWAVMTIALWVTGYLIPGIEFASPTALVVAALVLGFLNAVLKPVLVLLTLPFTIMTLGIFYLVINAVVFALAAVLVPGFAVTGFGPALLGAILVSLVSWLVGGTLRTHNHERHRRGG